MGCGQMIKIKLIMMDDVHACQQLMATRADYLVNEGYKLVKENHLVCILVYMFFIKRKQKSSLAL